MGDVYKKLTSLIGNTPLLELSKIEKEENLKAKVLVKLEYFNPGGSVKDRVALAMVEAAERSGALRPGGTIIEPTSGNTGMLGCIAKAKELHEQIPNSIIPQQFDNPSNPAIHELTTGQEIWHDTEGEVDIFVAGVGTGGTVSGVAKALKAHKAAVKAYAVEPADSPVLAGGKPAPHKIQGIGPGFVAKNYDASVVDGIIEVKNEEAFEASRHLARTAGLIVGISSGAAAHAAIELAKKPENEGKTIVALLPDTGERYLSTALYSID